MAVAKSSEYQERTVPVNELHDFIGWSAQGIQSTTLLLWGKIEAVTDDVRNDAFVVVTIMGNRYLVRIDNPIDGQPHRVTVGRSVDTSPRLTVSH